MRLVWTLRARTDLQTIIAYIADDSPDAAERIADIIAATVARLCEQPGLGRPRRKDGTRELIVRKASLASGYIIPYRVRGERCYPAAISFRATVRPSSLLRTAA
jgi:plasmid stabilization system protein ParE